MSTATTTTPLMTEAEFLRDYLDIKGVELVRGQLVRYPMPGFKHDEIEGNAYFLLREYVKANKLGRVTCGETKIRIRSNPTSIRASDVLFISYARMPKHEISPDGPLLIAPDVVAEVRSPSDQPGLMNEKVKEYLEAGVGAVISIDPVLESVSVHRLNEIDQRFHNGDTVTLPDVLPGFAAPVKAFFE